MRLQFLICVLFSVSGLFAQSETVQTPPLPVVANDTILQTTHVAFVTDTLGQVLVLTNRKIWSGVRVRHAVMLRRVEIFSNGTAKEVERYVATRRRGNRFTAEVWGVLPLKK